MCLARGFRLTPKFGTLVSGGTNILRAKVKAPARGMVPAAVSREDVTSKRSPLSKQREQSFDLYVGRRH